MPRHRKFNFSRYYFGLCIRVLFILIFSQNSAAQNKDSLPFPIHDRRGDFVSGNKRTIDLNPSNIRDSIAYDTATRRYYVYEKIGNKYYRTPAWYTYDEFMAIQGRKAEIEYFKKRANTLSVLNRKLLKPKLNIYDNLFNRLFGNGKIEIQPQGNVDITAGYQDQNIKNPTLPERAQKNGGFDFDMAAQLNVNANIGDKLKFPINYNTLQIHRLALRFLISKN